MSNSYNPGDTLADLPWATIILGNNELHIVEKQSVDDAPGISIHGGLGTSRGCGKISWKQQKAGQDYTHSVEIVLLQGKRRYDDPNNYTGELYIGINNGGEGDGNMKDALLIHHDGIQSAFPLNDAGRGRFYSGNGAWCWNYQDDGSVVLYDTHNSLDESTWTPKWAQRSDGSFEDLTA